MDINFLLTFTLPYFKEMIGGCETFFPFFFFFPNVKVYFQRTYRYLVLRAGHVEARIVSKDQQICIWDDLKFE